MITQIDQSKKFQMKIHRRKTKKIFPRQEEISVERVPLHLQQILLSHGQAIKVQ